MYGSLYRHLLLPFFDRVIKGRQTLAHWRAAEESQWWERSRLEAFQLLALRDLLQHAQATCPYYAETWKAAGLDPNTVHRLDDLARWPLTTRETIRQHRLAMRTMAPVKLMSKATGGSSGEPLHFDLDSGSNDRRTAMMFRGYGWAGGAPGTKQLFVWGSHVGKVPAWKRWKAEVHHRFDRHLILSCFEFTPEKMQQHLTRWNQYRPEVVVAYTNPLYEFARALEARGKRPLSPRGIVVGAEKLHDFQRVVIERVFGAP
ncbi:MAG TPA: phenylacetate--CoA ligase family protein, partial [Planctomycetaceae bacterium]|nr:phenylacetate--CoA ligase family protein [Planctomycetaceae bacterium]